MAVAAASLHHDRNRGEDRRYRRDPQGRQPGVQVGVAGTGQRASGGKQQTGNLHQPQPERGEEEHRRQQEGQVQPRAWLDHESGWARYDIPTHPVEGDEQQEGDDGEGGQKPSAAASAGSVKT